MEKLAETRLAKVKLTPEKVAVLWACMDSEGPLIPAEIARIVSRESQSVTGLLNRMEREGLVKRIPKRKGRPFTEIKLTQKGEDACKVGVDVLKSVISDVMSSIGDKELEQLQNPLRTIRQKVIDDLHLELTAFSRYSSKTAT
jgi:DNA-binding MarR family transcriptional regulator